LYEQALSFNFRRELTMTKYFRSILFLLAVACPFTSIAIAQDVNYTVSIPQPTTRLVHVTMNINNNPRDTVDVALPMWTPGGYGMSWWVKNLREFHAVDDSGNSLYSRQVGTSQWRVTTPNGNARIHYKIYVADRRGTASLDDSHYRLNGPGTLMYAIGNDPYPAAGELTVQFDVPDGWVFATGLEEIGPGKFTAPDYDTLIDAPVEAAAELDQFSFEDHGVKYELAIRNPHNYDRDEFASEIKAIVAEQAEMMGGMPFDRYVFLLTGINTRGGGLEHLNSTTISFKRYDDTSSPDYHRLQFLVAHEFFHLWNVKRIRPEILGPFDYSKPQHSRNLYVSEGITDYYGYLTTARAGVWTKEELYAELAKVIETLQSRPGRLITSVEDASYRVWTRGDIPAHTDISYYIKGSLIGLLLDLEIRARSENRRSLDDVFRYLMENHGLPKPGFEEERGFQDIVSHITVEGGGNGDYAEFFQRYVAGVEELDYNAYLKHAGLQLEVKEQEDKFRPFLGLGTEMSGDLMKVTELEYDGAAYRAGLMTGDILVTLNGERLIPSTLQARMDTIGVGGQAEIQALRGDRLVSVTVTLAEERPLSYKIVETESAAASAVNLRESWLTPYAK
jgi:predicted metalloprotease with PDZ domain